MTMSYLLVGSGVRLLAHSLTACLYLVRELHDMKIQAGVASNGDSRVRAVLESLEILHLLELCILSEEEGCAKPSSEIWTRSIAKSGIQTLQH